MRHHTTSDSLEGCVWQHFHIDHEILLNAVWNVALKTPVWNVALKTPVWNMVLETPVWNMALETLAPSTGLFVARGDLKSYHLHIKVLYIESTERYKHQIQMITEYC
jgi:hypothetical protein